MSDLASPWLLVALGMWAGFAVVVLAAVAHSRRGAGRPTRRQLRREAREWDAIVRFETSVDGWPNPPKT